MNDLPLSRNGENAQSVAIRAAKQAGTILKDLFHQDKQIEAKGNRNLVTEADLKAEKVILETLNTEFPEHNILCEESGKREQNSDYCWIIDPLDGTTNYAFGIPHFCVSIALTRNDDTVIGILYDPIRDELFRSEKGKGAFRNDVPLTISDRQDLKTRIIGFDLGYDDTASQEMIAFASKLWTSQTTFRLMGSAALGITYIACGRIDLYFHRNLYPWDIAAAMLVLREAGGEITDWEGKPADVRSSKVIACGYFNRIQESLDVLR